MCVSVGSSEKVVRSYIYLGSLSISKKTGFDNEALLQRSEKSPEWRDWRIFNTVKVGFTKIIIQKRV